MRVVIYEPDHRGHHFAILSHVVPEMSRLADEVILVTTPTAASSPQFQLHLGTYVDTFAVDTSIGEKAPASQLKHAIRGYKQLRQIARQLRPDHIYVPYGEGVAQAVGVAGLAGMRPWGRHTEAEVLLMRGGFQYPAENYRRKLLNRVGPRAIALGSWTRVHHLNPDDVAVLENYDSDRPGRFRLMPDPVEPPPTATKAEARRELGVPEDGRYIGCAGGIDRRKGMHLLVRAFLASQHALRAEDRLLLAGPMEQEIRSLLQLEGADAVGQQRVLLIDRPLTPREFGLSLAAMDVVSTPYPSHPHSASIVIHAAASGRLVLGSAIGWMQRTVRDFELGMTCNVRDHENFCAAIAQTLDASEAFRPSKSSRRFVAYHSAANFCAHWTMRLRERLGLPVDENLLPWNEVVEHTDRREHVAAARTNQQAKAAPSGGAGFTG